MLAGQFYKKRSRRGSSLNISRHAYLHEGLVCETDAVFYYGMPRFKAIFSYIWFNSRFDLYYNFVCVVLHDYQVLEILMFDI